MTESYTILTELLILLMLLVFGNCVKIAVMLKNTQPIISQTHQVKCIPKTFMLMAELAVNKCLIQ
nr:hypothetical protein [Oxalobacteraceae bacterium]